MIGCYVFDPFHELQRPIGTRIPSGLIEEVLLMSSSIHQSHEKRRLVYINQQMDSSMAANQPLIEGSNFGSGTCDGRSFRRHNCHLTAFVLNDRQAAVVAAVYTICASSITFFGYCFLAVATSYQAKHMADVYWGVQASYAAVMMAELTSLCLSTTLLIAIYQSTKENCSLMVPWVLGFIGSISLEALAIVYSNVLRDHINQGFDQLCHFEVGVFLSKTFINIIVIGAVVRLYRQLKDGVTWRVNDIYEL
ncbi:uncharacterized protein LOC116924781 isoform X3 [Daphnia magna]|uniref:uncharacterized protein LOC116924781 isoform X3 n=1 Tax=Daphnia magna TaxID=35525 RepID=UPI001E1BA200|nr:uncharacterized protein LOC116924781 isoform X3 [Daphnia magna]